MKATRSSTDTYLNITSHYLNTPLSILGNSLELATFLHELSERTTTELKQKISHLTLSIRAITTQYQALATQEEASTQPELTPAKKNHLSRDFLTPTIVALGLVAVFVILYTGVFNIEFSLVNIIFWSLVCAAAVGLAGFAFYTRSRLKNIHTKLKNEQSYEDAMMQQRLQFIGDTYKALSAELKAIRLSASVISDTEHVRPFFNGLAMLEKLTSSLQMASGFISPQSSQHMNISFVTKDLLERWITYAAQEQLSVSYTIQPELTVLASTDDITQLVNATIDNAIRFSSRGSTIFFELKKVAKRAVFVIHNDGNAIPAERLQQLFEPFSRATDTIQYDQEGIGLSLYINKIIVDRLGGKIDIMSAPDKGTTVIISLPLARKRRNAPGARVITPQASVPLGTVQ